MKNKEAILKLTEYFLLQDRGLIARALANMMIDLNRLDKYESLPPKEAEVLAIRIEKNLDQLRDFLKEEGENKKMELIELNSES
jgi:hypothetical protein